MVTIAGTLTDASGVAIAGCPIDFLLTTAPQDDAAGFVSGKTIRETTGTGVSAGSYSVQLKSGVYRVRIPGTKESFVYVPGGSGTYSLNELAVVTEDNDMARGWPVFAVYTDVALEAVNGYDVIAVDSDINGRPGFFRRNDAYTVMIEGADGVTDIDGRIFKRQTYE